MSDRTDIDSPLRDTDPLLWNALWAAHLFDSIDISVLENDAGRAEALLAGKRLAKFIQREYPADDDEPVTHKWLDSLFGPEEYICTEHDDNFDEVITWIDTIGNVLIPLPKTRGDFRRLCKVFEIELKESPQH